MSDFDGNTSNRAEWADVPILSTSARALGGADGPMNAQAIALSARTNYLKYEADQLLAATLRALYGDGPYPTLDLRFAGATLLDPRIEFSRASTATYFDERGMLRTAAIDEPRFAYDPATGAAQGLLVEGQATNLVVLSSHPNNSPSGVTIGEEQVSLGILELFSIVEDASNGPHYTRSPNIDRVAGKSYTESFYAKGAGRRIYVFSSASVWGANTGVRFNLDTGEVEQTLNATARMVRVAEDVWRCEFTVTALATGSDSWRYYLHNGSSFSYQGDGVSGVFVGGMQSEEGTRATSYIPTGGSQVTRASDGVIIPTSDWFNSSGGTFIVDFVAPGSTGFNTLIGMGSTTTEEFRLGYSQSIGSALRITARVGATQTETPTAIIQPGQRYKAAASYRPTSNGVEWKLVVSGDVIGTAETERLPTGFVDNGVAVGRRRPNSNTLNWNGTAANIAYYPRALSNAELEALTS